MNIVLWLVKTPYAEMVQGVFIYFISDSNSITDCALFALDFSNFSKVNGRIGAKSWLSRVIPANEITNAHATKKSDTAPIRARIELIFWRLAAPLVWITTFIVF